MRKIALLTAMLLSMTCGPVTSWAETPTTVHRDADQEQAVRTVVTEFGKRLRMVAVLAPKEIAAKAMDSEYSPLVSAEILTAWKNDPKNAPGKQTSSPWPTRIDIDSVRVNAARTYVVKGKVILITADEVKYGGIFQANPVTMTVAQEHGKWLITTYKEVEGPVR